MFIIVYKSHCKQIMNEIVMESIRNIVIVGGQDENPSRFITQIEPVKLDVEHEMAITSLYQSDVLNIHTENNKVYFYHGTRGEIEVVKSLKGKSDVMVPSALTNYRQPDLRVITIPNGTYTSSINLCWVISNRIRDSLGLAKRRDAMNPTMDRQYNIINVEMVGTYFVIEGKSDTPWSLLNIYEDKYDRFTIQESDLQCAESPAFLYANIIENSYINGKLSRNLGVIPIKNTRGWALYEPKYPIYVPITVREFSKILIEIRDMNGEYIKFNPLYKTIITLSIRPIKGNKVKN